MPQHTIIALSSLYLSEKFKNENESDIIGSGKIKYQEHWQKLSRLTFFRTLEINQRLKQSRTVRIY